MATRMAVSGLFAGVLAAGTGLAQASTHQTGSSPTHTPRVSTHSTPVPSHTTPPRHTTPSHSTTPHTTPPRTTTPPHTTPPVNTPDPAVTAANSEVTTARQALDKANKDYQATQDRLLKEYEGSPEVSEALAALKAAAAKLDAVRTPVVDKVKATPDYRDTSAATEAQELRYRQLHDAGVGAEEVMKVGESIAALKAANAKRIADACAARPEVVAAQKAYDDALVSVNLKRAAFKKSLETNAEVVSSKSARDAAAKALRDAQTKVASLRH